jgi:predicted membrane protein
MKKSFSIISCIFLVLIGLSLLGSHTIWGILLLLFAILALIGAIATKKEGNTTEEQPENTVEVTSNQKSKLKRTLLIIASILLGFFILAIIGNNLDSEKQGNKSKAPVTAGSKHEEKQGIEKVETEVKQVKKTKYQWQYSQDTDPMTSDERYFANIYSTTWLSFKFPYNGGSEAYLVVRNMDGDNEVYLKVTKGQFISSYNYSECLRIRFDSDKPIDVFYTSPSDGSSDLIFLDSPDELIKRIKKAKSFIIEVAFYQEGNKLLNFNYDDFVWDH